LKSLQVEVRLSLGKIKVREYTAWIDNYIESRPKKQLIPQSWKANKIGKAQSQGKLLCRLQVYNCLVAFNLCKREISACRALK